MRTPKAVVFDIGNVLIEWQPERLYAQLIPDPVARRAFFTETKIADMNLQVDRGAPFKEHIYAHAEKHPKHREHIRAWHDRWIEMTSPAIDGSVALLRKLKARGVPVYALSNFGRESFAHACTIYPFLNEFDIPVISGREGALKPEPRIYEILEQRSGLLGQDLFFTDDSQANVDAARMRGWQAELFSYSHELGATLEKFGLISGDT